MIDKDYFLFIYMYVELVKITEFIDEKPVVLITLYYIRSIYLYLGNPPFLILTIIWN